jgi:hypothetical protein
MRRGRDRDEGMVYVSIVLIVLFGCLSLPGKYEHIWTYLCCCAFQWSIYLWSLYTSRCSLLIKKQIFPVGDATSYEISPMNTSVEGRKLTLKFCVKYDCEVDGGSKTCYCCDNQQQPNLCYDERKDCQAHCPACNPQCPPEHFNQTEIAGQPSKAVIMNATLV